MLIFCAIATPRPRAPTSCNPFVRRFNVACTPAQPQSGLASHNIQHGRTSSRSGTRAAKTAHPPRNVRSTSTSRTKAVAAGSPPRSRPTASFGYNIVASMLPHPCLARHVALHLAAPCYAGPAPLCCALFRTPRKPNARPAHLAAFAWALCVCVCVGCVLCAVPVDMFLAFGSAVVRYPVASAFCCFVRCCARVIGCSPTPRCRGCALVVCCTVRTVCAKVACGFAFADACGSLSVVPPHHTTSIHHTPHHAISTHLIHHTPRIPTIFTTTHYHSFLSTQVWDGVQFTVCLGCTVCA